MTDESGAIGVIKFSEKDADWIEWKAKFMGQARLKKFKKAYLGMYGKKADGSNVILVSDEVYMG